MKRWVVGRWVLGTNMESFIVGERRLGCDGTIGNVGSKLRYAQRPDRPQAQPIPWPALMADS
jgi:hypothetical protein